MLIARNPIRFGLIQISLLAALVAFLTKYQALPLVGLPFLVMFFGRSDPRFGRHLTAAVILTAGVALWLHFIYDIYQVQQQHVYKFPDTDTPGLVTKDNLLIPISLGAGVTRLLVGLSKIRGVVGWWPGLRRSGTRPGGDGQAETSPVHEPPYLLVTVFFGLLAASIRPLERGRMDWIGIGLIGLFVASSSPRALAPKERQTVTLLMSLFRHMALVYWQPAIVFLCILWAVAVDYVAKRCRTADASRRPRHVDEIQAASDAPVGLGVTKTYSRPQVSNDNPYSESQFKTLKYRPEFPSGSVRSNTLVTFVEICSAGTTPNTTHPRHRSTYT